MIESLQLIAVGVALCAAMRLCHWKLGIIGVVALSAVCMTRLSITAGVVIEVFGFRSNFGCLLYVPVLFGTVLCSRGDFKQAWMQISGVFAGIIAAAFLLWAVQSLPLADNGNLAHIRALSEVSSRVVTASFLAFIIGNGVCLALMRHTGNAILAQIVAQAADSLIFFPIAFGNQPDFPIMQTMADGFAIKSMIVIVSAPLLIGAREPEKIKL